MNYRYPVFIILFLFFCSGRDVLLSQGKSYKDIQFTELFRRTEGWIAGDGAYSIPIGDNKTLWTFGDSYIDCYDSSTKTVPCLFQARNAALIIDASGTTVQNKLTNFKKESSFFTAGADGKYWFWPLSGFRKKDTAYVFLSRFRFTGEPGMWGFAGVDSNYIAKIQTSDLSNVSYSLLASKSGITFGTSVIEKGGFIFIYGIKSNGFGNDLFLARFHTGNIYAPWQYFDGEGWTTDLTRIQKIHSEFTSSFYICKIRNTYVLITTEFSVGCDQGKNIFAAKSKNPYGPFTDQHSIWQLDDTLNGHYPFFYVANAHPEFKNGKDELLITYCINGYGTCVETCVNNRLNPDVYRPKAIRVPYNIILRNSK
jgi:hypothetical protein